MAPNYLEYSLKDGYVENWIVAGPVITPVTGLSGQEGRQIERRQVVFSQMAGALPVFENPPVEYTDVILEGKPLRWNYTRCREDHWVNVSADYAVWSHCSTYAYAEVSLRTPEKIAVELKASGPAEIWLNEQSIGKIAGAGDEINTFQATVAFEKTNRILVRFEQLGSLSCRNLMSLRLARHEDQDSIQEIKVRLPTIARHPRRFMQLEQVLEKAHLEEVVNYKGASFNLRWAEDVGEDFQFGYQVQDDQERIYVEGTWGVNATEPVDIGHTFRLFERPFRIVLKAPPREYYEMNNRYQRVIPLYVIDTPYAETPYGSYAVRRGEALKDAAKREDKLFGQIARMGQGNWAELTPAVFASAIEQVNRREAGSDVLLMGLLGAALRFGSHEKFPADQEALHAAARDFKYKPDGTGGDALEFDSEAHAIVLLACELLASKCYPDMSTGAASLTAETASWLKEKGRNGFKSWLSNSKVELVIAALAHITSLADDETVRELAAILLDKVLLDLAVHTYKGAFGTAHAKTEASMIKSSQLEATSGITRLLYGLGVYNPHIAGVVSLALSDYEYPTFYGQIAADQSAEILSKENQGGVSTVTYRTPDYMLSSVQDWKAGQPGKAEHVWQATLGPDALVFSNRPAVSSEEAANRPGYWLGNETLPRVAQWKDALVAVYGETPPESLGFTHAYFPIYKFDEWEMKDGWAYARKGKGYLAITAARGLELVKHGPGGYCELRSYDAPNIWICQMGRESQDGSFSDFQRKVKKIHLAWSGNAVHFKTLRGEKVQFGWEGPLVVDEAAQKLAFEKMIDNPYCTAEPGASILEIQYEGTIMRLNFE